MQVSRPRPADVPAARPTSPGSAPTSAPAHATTAPTTATTATTMRADAFGGTPPTTTTTRTPTASGSIAAGTSPLGVRLRQAIPEASLVQSLGASLGVDLSAMSAELSALPGKALHNARLEMTLQLDDARTISLPLPDGRPLRIEVPRCPYGIVARVVVDVGMDDKGPFLKGASLVFDTPAHAKDAEARGLGAIHLPALTNPSVLKAPPTSLAGRLAAAATDAAADVRLRAVRIDGDGNVALDGHIHVLGMPHQDLQEAAGATLPKVPTRLPAGAGASSVSTSASASSSNASSSMSSGAEAPLANGSAPAMAARPLSPMALAELFAFASYGGQVRLDVEGAGGAKVSAQADLAIDRDLRVRADVRVTGDVVGQQAGVHVAAQADLKQARGALSVDAGAKPQAADVDQPAQLPAGRAVTWSPDGVQLAGLPVDDILPVQLEASKGRQAPRVGSAAFRAEVAALLDETAPAQAGCDIAYFARGDDVLQERLRAIGSAGRGDTVLVQTFIFKDDVTGSKVVDALIAAKERGATVKVLIDAIGSVKQPEDAVLGPPAYRRMKEAGVDVALIAAPHVPLQQLTRRMGEALLRLPTDADARARIAQGAPALHRLLVDQQNPATRLDARLPTLLQDPAQALAFAVELARVGVELKTGAVDHAIQSAALRELVDVTSHSADLLRQLGRDHRKQLIVFGPGDDDKATGTRNGPTVLMGGNNIGDDYQLERDAPDYDVVTHKGLPLWNDAEARITGAGFAHEASRAFARTWQETTGRADAPIAAPLAAPDTAADATAPRPTRNDDVTLRLVTHRPLDRATGDAQHETTNLLLKALDGAGKGDRVTIENPYFHPIPALKDAMIRAARRGAQLQIVTNGPHDNNDAKLVSQLSRRFVLRDLVNEPGIAVFETRGDADPIHRKTFLMQTRDGQDLWVLGSQNLDGLSTRINREVVVVGGSALRSDITRTDAVGRGLAEDAKTDTDPKVSTRLRPDDLRNDDVAVLASEWARSLLLPVL